MIKYVLFDLDGTVTDSFEGISNGVKYALSHYGIIETRESTLRKYIGPPLRESFPNYGGISSRECEEVIAKYREYYNAKGIFQFKVYDGIEDVFKKVLDMGKKTVLATSKPEDYAKRILKSAALDKYFTAICGATQSGSRDTKADVIKYLLETANASPNECIMVGDRMYDVEGAAECGIKCIGVSFGFGSKKELLDAGAIAIAEKPCDIPNLIKKLD